MIASPSAAARRRASPRTSSGPPTTTSFQARTRQAVVQARAIGIPQVIPRQAGIERRQMVLGMGQEPMAPCRFFLSVTHDENIHDGVSILRVPRNLSNQWQRAGFAAFPGTRQD